MQLVLDYGHMRDNTGILLYLFRQSCEITCTFSCIVLLLYNIHVSQPTLPTAVYRGVLQRVRPARRRDLRFSET